LRPQQLRGMALELAVAFAQAGKELPEALVSTLNGMLELPLHFPADPTCLFLSAGPGGRPAAHPRARLVASWLDRGHWVATGAMMPVSQLRRGVEKALGPSSAPGRATLRRWREDPEYRSAVEMAKPE
jgi:hypothetical protein